MVGFLEFLRNLVGGAAISTAVLAVFARPLSSIIRRLVYPSKKTPRTYTASV